VLLPIDLALLFGFTLQILKETPFQSLVSEVSWPGIVLHMGVEPQMVQVPSFDYHLPELILDSLLPPFIDYLLQQVPLSIVGPVILSVQHDSSILPHLHKCRIQGLT